LLRGCATSDWRSTDVVGRNQDGTSSTCPAYNAVWPPSYLSVAVAGPGWYTVVVEGYGYEGGPYAFTWSLVVTGGSMNGGVATASPTPSRSLAVSSTATRSPTATASATPAVSPAAVSLCSCGYYGVGCSSYQATSFLNVATGSGLERGSTDGITNW
jgi:hypothetical protein